jgi:drug/metabolite transporter (DMT)-like permease
MILVTLRWVLAFGVLGAIGWKQFLADWPRVRRHLLLLFLLGTCGFTFFNALFYTALIHTTAINVSIEQAGMPMLVILINFLLFRLRATWLQLVGAVVTIAGVAITACHGDPRQLLALSFFSFVTALPFAWWEIGTGRAIYPDLTGWTIAFYVALFPSALSQILYIRGNELIGSNRAALFINLVPIFGTVLAVVLVGEKFQSYHALAMVLVLGGIWLAENSGRKHAARTSA